MTAEWRLLDPGPMPAWRQMALDATIIRSRARGDSPDTFRFMEFSPHTVLVGYHQAVDQEVRRGAALELGIEINRRITGGGAIYMDSRQLGWELCVGKDRPDLAVEAESVYRRLSAVAIRALERLGIRAAFRPVNDVEVDGRKISGTGGVDWGEALIYQGTLLVDFDVDTMIRVLKLPLEKLTDKETSTFRRRVVTLRELLGTVPSVEEVKRTMVAALEETLNVRVVPGELSAREREEWERTQGQFLQDAWIDRRRAPEGGAGQELSVAAHKAPGGLLRGHLVLDRGAGRIRRAFLTGDFFVRPDRAVLDLEARLKDAPMDAGALVRILDAHYGAGNHYENVSVPDWLSLFEKAIAASEKNAGAASKNADAESADRRF